VLFYDVCDEHEHPLCGDDWLRSDIPLDDSSTARTPEVLTSAPLHFASLRLKLVGWAGEDADNLIIPGRNLSGINQP